MDPARILVVDDLMRLAESNPHCENNDAVLSSVKTRLDETAVCDQILAQATTADDKLVRIGLYFIESTKQWVDGEVYNETSHYAFDKIDECSAYAGCEAVLDCEDNSTSTISLGTVAKFTCYLNSVPTVSPTAAANTTAETVLNTIAQTVVSQFQVARQAALPVATDASVLELVTSEETTTAEEAAEDKPPVALIAGLVVGLFVLFSIIGIAICCVCHHKKKKRRKTAPKEEGEEGAEEEAAEEE